MMARALARAASARRLISAARSNSPTIRRCSSSGGSGVWSVADYSLADVRLRSADALTDQFFAFVK